MPRIRTIKPEFWADEKLAPLAPTDRLVFLGLICMADDAGRLVDNVKAIDGFIFPSTQDSARESLDTLASLSRIVRYQSESGQGLIQIANWRKHQKIDRPSKHVLPGVPRRHSRDGSEDSSSVQRDCIEDSSMDLGSWTVDQGPRSGKADLGPEVEAAPLCDEPGSADEPASAAPPTSEPQPQPQPLTAEPVAPVPASPAHQIPWPEDALEFGRTFYPRGQATDQRRADIHAQITATLNGGCIFRNGLVRASSEQLARRCREVLSAPPSRGDSAIVVLLTKLSDVGNALDSPTERAQAASRVAFADDRTTLDAWRAAHPDDAAAIDAKMLRLFPTPGEIVARQSCADGAIRKRIADDASAHTGALKSPSPNGPSP